MVKIKICGIRREHDVEIVNKYLPDFVGFIFYPPSKRYIAPEKACKLAHMLSHSIKRVGVFVNEEIDKLRSIAKQCSLDIVQLHGDEDTNYCRLLDMPYWKVIHVDKNRILRAYNKYKAEAYLFDAFAGRKYGGVGRTFEWEVLKGISEKTKMILAGGLNADNVKEAIEMIRPWGIDISSGVETDGYKDEGKIKRVIEIIRSCEV